MYLGKPHTQSQVAWNRPQSTSSRVDSELMQKSAQALATATDPLDKLRYLCLARGGSIGIMALGRVLRRMDDNGSRQLNKEKFMNGIKETGLDLNESEAEELFAQFEHDDTGSISLDEFLLKLRPPMSESRKTILEKAFYKLDKTGEGVLTVADLTRTFSVNSNSRYMSGEESEGDVMKAFLASFETEGTADGTVTFEEFMNYYSGLSVSIDNDCYFDLMMRQAFKL